MPTHLAIAGAAGRMGRRLIALAAADETLRVVAALESTDSPHLGADAGDLAGIGRAGLRVVDKTDAPFDVLIDFSSPAGTDHWLAVCRARRRAIVIGTTGHADAQREDIRSAAGVIPVLKAANMSVGVNVLLRAVRQLAAALDESYDVEIVETHHRFKKDAPSGTALALLEAVHAGRHDAGRALGDVRYGRGHTEPGAPAKGTPARTPGEITLHALRLGDTIGDHTVHFAALGETITISHSAHTRDTFAAGALRAAAWLARQPAGLYTMQDVLSNPATDGRDPG